VLSVCLSAIPDTEKFIAACNSSLPAT
jgi:hypothetical protein